MPSSVALPSPAERHQSLTYENHPQFGDYIYSPTDNSWTQRRQMSGGHPLLLCGRGRRPTDEQIAVFQQIDERLPELTASAIATVRPPPELPPGFTSGDLFLWEVRIEADLTFALFFDTPTGLEMWPMVTFSDWRVSGSEWVC